MRVAARAQATPEMDSNAPLQPFVRSKSPVADQDQRLLAPGFEDLASPFLSTPVTIPPGENTPKTSGALADVTIQRKADAGTAASPGKSPLALHTGTVTSVKDPSPVLAQPHNDVPHAAPPVKKTAGINSASQAKPTVVEPQIGSEAPDPPVTRRPELTPVRPTTEQTSTPDSSLESAAQVSAPRQTIEQSFVVVTNTHNITELQQEAEVEPSFPPTLASPNELIPSVRPMVDFPANQPLREPEPPTNPEPRSESGKGEERVVQQTAHVATQPATAASVSVIGPLNRDVPIHRRLSLRHR